MQELYQIKAEGKCPKHIHPKEEVAGVVLEDPTLNEDLDAEDGEGQAYGNKEDHIVLSRHRGENPNIVEKKGNEEKEDERALE